MEEMLGDVGLISGLGRFPGGGHGNWLQYSCLNPIDGGAWWAIAHGVTKSWTWLKWLCMHTHMHASGVEWVSNPVWPLSFSEDGYVKADPQGEHHMNDAGRTEGHQGPTTVRSWRRWRGVPPAPLETSEGEQLCPHLDFGLLLSRSVRE